MHDRDRFWWLIVFAGVACWFAAVVVPYQFMATAPTPAENRFVTNDEYRGWIGFSIAFGVAFLGFGVFFIIMAVRARRRHRIRLAALQGDLSMMPPAAIRTEPAAALDLTGQPLEIMWRTGKTTGVFYGLMLGVQALLVLLMAGLDTFAFIAPIFTAPQPSTEDLINGTSPQPLSVLEIIGHIALASVGVAIIVAIVVVGVRATPFLFGRPFGVTATNRGIDARTEFGARIHMNWDEARLLEAVGGNTQVKRRFNLFAPGKKISWTEYTTGLGAQYTPVNATASEITLRQVALLNLIVARTNHSPRTLAKGLAKTQPDSSSPKGIATMQGSLLAPAREGKRSSTAITLLVMALIVAGIAVADFFVPVTPFPWVNWVSTGSVALAALILIIASVRELGADNVLPAYAQPPSAAAPSLAAPGAAYVFSWRVRPLRRLGLIILGVCLSFNLIPCAWVCLQLFGIYLPGFHPQFTADAPTTYIVRIFLTMTLALTVLIGLGLALGALTARTGRVRTSTDGLTTENGKLKRLIPWSSIQDISWGAGSGGQFSYLVKTDVPTIQASWPAGSQAANISPPDDGALPVGADELAALVAAQIGKPILVREER